MTVAFIGCGVMASAIARGVAAAHQEALHQEKAPNPPKPELLLYDLDTDKAQQLATEIGAQAVTRLEDLATADMVVLAVKPQVVPQVLSVFTPMLAERVAGGLPLPVVVSIAAGVSLAQLEEACPPRTPVVRVMPNLAAKVRAAMTAVAGGKHATAAHVQEVRNLFAAVGRTAALAEDKFGVFIALAGSSPGFVFEFIDSLARGGVLAGIPKDAAVRYAAQTVLGSAQLALTEADAGGLTPAALADAVCSPGGTTIAGMAALDAHGFSTAVVEAMRATMHRDQELAGG